MTTALYTRTLVERWRGKESGFVWGQTLSFKLCHCASSASLEKAAWLPGVSPMMFLSLLMSKQPSFPRPPSCRVMTATSVSSSDCHFYHAPSPQVFPSCLHSVRLKWGPVHVHQSHSLGPGKIYSGSITAGLSFLPALYTIKVTTSACAPIPLLRPREDLHWLSRLRWL